MCWDSALSKILCPSFFFGYLRDEKKQPRLNKKQETRNEK